ncbi:hypothetical protein BC941DRAFT_257375 [Chlamydoabsidia padenii]|nr:hypothetical protein BC941DRAFT_257375 [Chlamydoabsidia padenii]
MGLEKEVMHVVIKLPFKRPVDFVEPPPVVWTDDMEHQLWKYMNQKHTDWNYIAEQLGVPTPYLVRHAAFMYETQLRGIQQQLRISEAGRPSTIASPPPPTVSTSTSSTTTHRSSRPSSQKQVRPVSSLSSSSRTQQRNSSVWKDAQEHQDGGGYATGPRLNMNEIPTDPPPTSAYHSTSEAPMITSSMDVAATATATVPNHRYEHSISHDDSMMLSTISNISPRTTTTNSNPDPLSPHDSHSIYTATNSQQQQQHSSTSPSSNNNTQQVGQGSDELESARYSDNDDDDGFSKHFERMKLKQLEEPAFLPSKRMEGSQLLNSLRASSHYGRSILSGTPPSSSLSNPTSSSSSSSPRQNISSLLHQQIHSNTSNEDQDEKSGDSMDDDRNGKARMVFGPNLSRVASSAQQPMDDVNKETNSALNSVGSSFSDLSDYSVTQSALEDAFMSKLNNGSKMSSLAFSRKYT